MSIAQARVPQHNDAHPFVGHGVLDEGAIDFELRGGHTVLLLYLVQTHVTRCLPLMVPSRDGLPTPGILPRQVALSDRVC